MMARRTRNSLTRHAARRWHLHLLLSFSFLLLLFPVCRKKRSRPSSFHEPFSQPPSGETTTMTLPAVTCEWPSQTLCRPIAGDTWTPLGLSPSPPPRGHPRSRVDYEERRGRLTPSCRPSCYGHSTVDLWMDGARLFVHTSGMIRHDSRFHIVFLYLKRHCWRIGQLVLDLKMPKRVTVY